jgi:hypothetical protein
MNDGKHEGKTKVKMNPEKPERSVRKSRREVNQEICPFVAAIFECGYSEVDASYQPLDTRARGFER